MPLLFAGVGGVFAVIGAIVYAVLFSRYEKFARRLSIALFLIGLFILLADIFAPLQLPPLDGRARMSDQPLSLTCLEGGIALALLFIGWRLERQSLYGIALPTAACIWIGSVLYLLVIVGTPKASPAKNANTALRPELKNIYHIVLDELQTDAMLSVMADLNLFKHFDGFKLFPYNSSSYLFTRASFPNYMSGTTYHGDVPFKDWTDIYKRHGILPSLSEQGYVLSMNVPDETWANQYVADYKTLDETMRAVLPYPLVGFGDFFPLWLARISPNFMTNRSLKLGAKYADRIARVFGGTDRYPSTINRGKEPFSSVLMFKNAIAQERNLSPFGRYTYLHAIIPHGPYVIDGACKYNNSLPQGRARGYYQQAVCSLKLVVEFVKKLKRLGRYDNSIIIVHADTGHGLRGFMHLEGKGLAASESSEPKLEPGVGGVAYPYWTSRQILARTLSALMVKPAGSRGAAEISTRRSKLIDLYPTLMEMIDVSKIDKMAEGRSLFSDEKEIAGRENSYFFYDPREASPNVQKFIWDEQAVSPRIEAALATLPYRQVVRGEGIARR